MTLAENLRVCIIVCVCVCAHLYVFLSDLDLRCVNVVHQQAQRPAVHLLDPHSLRPALRHLSCRCDSVR